MHEPVACALNNNMSAKTAHLLANTVIATMALIACVGLFLPGTVEYSNAVVDRAFDALHIPAFLAISYSICIVLTKFYGSRYRLVFLTTCALALAAEYMQQFIGRDTSLIDAMFGTFGGLLGCIGHWIVVSAPRQRYLIWYLPLTALFMVLAFEPAWQEFRAYRAQIALFPVLGDFEKPLEMKLWKAYHIRGMGNSTAIPNNIHAVHGLNSLAVNLPKAQYAGIEHRANMSDWTTFNSLVFHIFNPDKPFKLNIRIDDSLPAGDYNSRFNATFWIENGQNKIDIPIERIKNHIYSRPFKLNKISYLRMFVASKELPNTFYVDWVRLE